MLRNLARFSFLLFMFALPWENQILIPGFGTVSRLFGIVAFPLCAAYIFSSGKFRAPTFPIIFSLFAGWVLLTFIWSEPDAIIVPITVIQMLLFVWLITEMCEVSNDIDHVLKVFLLGCLVSVGSTIQNYFAGNFAVGTTRAAATGFNPNDIALILALGLPVALYFVTQGRRLWMAIGLAYVPLGFYAILLTASRSGFIAGLVGCSYPLLLLDDRKSRGKALLILGAAVIAAVPAALMVIPEASRDRLAMIGPSILEGTMNSRTTIWAAALEVVNNAPVLGVGVGNFTTELKRQQGMEIVAHNAFLTILAETGPIGFLLFLLVLGVAIWKVPTLPLPARRLWYVLLLVLLLAFIGANWEWRKQTWFVLTLAAIHSALQAREYRQGIQGRIEQLHQMHQSRG